MSGAERLNRTSVFRSYRLDAHDGTVALLKAVAGSATAALDAGITANSGYVKVLTRNGTAPFDFFRVGKITPRGRLELERTLRPMPRQSNARLS